MYTHEDVIPSMLWGLNESTVCCIYCKRGKRLIAYGHLSLNRAADLFGGVKVHIVGDEVKAPERVFIDAAPCCGCEVATPLSIGGILVAELSPENRLTGSFLVLETPVVRRFLSPEERDAAYTSGYFICGPKTWAELTRKRAS